MTRKKSIISTLILRTYVFDVTSTTRMDQFSFVGIHFISSTCRSLDNFRASTKR